MSTRIRRARAADAAELTRIAHVSKRHWGYAQKLIRLWRADLTITAASIATGCVYCASRDGEILGFYALSREGKVAEVEHLWVDPRWIGSGIGRRLFSHMMRRLRTLHVTRLEIASDPNAEGFYIRMGARRIGTVAARPRGRRLPLLMIRPRADS